MDVEANTKCLNGMPEDGNRRIALNRFTEAPPTKPDAQEIVWIPTEDAGWGYPDQPDFAG